MGYLWMQKSTKKLTTRLCFFILTPFVDRKIKNFSLAMWVKSLDPNISITIRFHCTSRNCLTQTYIIPVQTNKSLELVSRKISSLKLVLNIKKTMAAMLIGELKFICGLIFYLETSPYILNSNHSTTRNFNTPLIQNSASNLRHSCGLKIKGYLVLN